MQTPLVIFLVLALFGLKTQAAPFLPQPVDEDTFAALRTHSPFVRQVGVNHSLILTGVALIDEATVATLVNLETYETHVVTEGVTNTRGWQLVTLKGDQTDFESMMAQIKGPGGDLVSVRYQKPPPRPTVRQPTKTQLSDSQVQEIKVAANDPRKGFRGDGYRDVPPEILRKLSKLTPEQRLNINRKIVDLRNQGIDSDERRKIYNESIDQALKRRR
jgi:hypothetical protein